MSSSRAESVIRILYEDNHLIAVFKPARVPVQSDQSKDVSLLELVKAYLKAKYLKPGNVFLGMVHRLDRPVSGVVVFARTSKAAGRLSEVFRTRKVKKIYHALVEGKVEGEGRLENHIEKNEVGNTVSIKPSKTKDSKQAVLEYGVIRQRDQNTLLEIELLTGRKHQIRAQLAHIGHPIMGDKKYGATTSYREGEIALTAIRLEFPHPVKDEMVKVELEDDGFGVK